MKLLLIFMLVVVLVKTEFVVHTVTEKKDVFNNTEKDVRGITDITINKQVDSILSQVRTALKENGLDPTDLPDLTTEFSVKGIFTHKGRISITKGWMQDICTIMRSGDATFAIRLPMKAHVKVPIIIPNIEFGSDYKVKFDLVRRSGGIIGTVEHYQLYVHAVYDLTRQKIQFNKFDTTDIGKISVKLTGKTWSDWWMNAFIDAITESLHEEIVQVVNSTLVLVVDQIADVINNRRYSVNPDKFISLYDLNN